MNSCIYCATDCDRDNPTHLPVCPSVTNLWPIWEQDLRPHGMRCTRCHDEFAPGDSYVQTPVGATSGLDVVELVCVGCAALAVTA